MSVCWRMHVALNLVCWYLDVSRTFSPFCYSLSLVASKGVIANHGFPPTAFAFDNHKMFNMLSHMLLGMLDIKIWHDLAFWKPLELHLAVDYASLVEVIFGSVCLLSFIYLNLANVCGILWR
jgi:hypothetical protein